MQTEIDGSGNLKIRASNGLEIFALKMWFKAYMNSDDGVALQIISINGETISENKKKPNQDNWDDFVEDFRNLDTENGFPLDNEILNLLMQTKERMIPITIAEILQKEWEKEIEVKSVYEALLRLKKDGKVDDDDYNGVIKWIALEEIET